MNTNRRKPDKDEARILLNILCVLYLAFQCFNHTYLFRCVCVVVISAAAFFPCLYAFYLIPLDFVLEPDVHYFTVHINLLVVFFS